MSKKQSVKKTVLRILGYGGAFMDVVYRVPEEFVASLRGAKGGAYNCTWEEQEAIIASIPENCVKSRKIRAGGGVGNTLQQIAMQSGSMLRLLMCGVVGDDDEGRRYLCLLEEIGVDVGRVKVVSGGHTGRCLSLVTPDGERTMYTYQGINAELGNHCPLKKADFNGITAFYTEGYMLIDEPMMRRTLELACDVDGMEVHFDVGSAGVVLSHQNFMKFFLPNHVDFLYANYDEASAMTGAVTPQDIIDQLADAFLCPLVKLGKDGAIFCERSTNESVQRASGFPPLDEGVDTTGAGDAWAAGFIWAHLFANMPLEKCVDWANQQAHAVLQSRIIQDKLSDDDKRELLEEIMGKIFESMDLHKRRP